MQTFTFVFSGQYGSGKTICAVSYTPRGWDGKSQVKRLVIDKEFRAENYQSEVHGKSVDDPKNLLWSFKTFPAQEGQDMTLEQWRLLADIIKSPEQRPNVLIFDNIAQLQGDIEVWCQDAAGTTKYLEAVGIANKHKFFLEKRFKPDQYLRKVQQLGLRELILIAKRGGCDVVITTELQNKWENYGVSGYGSDGKPMQKIVGTQAKVWDEVLKLADVNWRLTRTGQVVMAAPEISIDPLRPKMSLVGVAPKFKFTTWADIWAMEAKRLVPTEQDMAGVVVPEPTYGTTDEAQATEQDPNQPKDEGTPESFWVWAKERGWTPQQASVVLRPLNLFPYKADNDMAMREALEKAKPNG